MLNYLKYSGHLELSVRCKCCWHDTSVSTLAKKIQWLTSLGPYTPGYGSTQEGVGLGGKRGYLRVRNRG